MTSPIISHFPTNCLRVRYCDNNTFFPNSIRHDREGLIYYPPEPYGPDYFDLPICALAIGDAVAFLQNVRAMKTIVCKQ